MAVSRENLGAPRGRSIDQSRSDWASCSCRRSRAVGIVVSSLGIPFWGWIVAYAVLGIIAIGVWHGDKWPNKSRDVLLAVLGTFLLGGLFFACDLVLGHLHDPDLSLVM